MLKIHVFVQLSFSTHTLQLLIQGLHEAESSSGKEQEWRRTILPN